MTPSEVVELYEGSLSALRPATRDNYALHARKLADWSAGTGVDFPNMRELDVIRYLRFRKETLGNAESTVLTVLNALRQFFAWAVKKGLIDTSPADGIPTKHEPARQQSSLSLHELRAMWELAPTDQHRVLVGLLGLTGMRSEEVLQLNVPDLVKVGDHHGFRLAVRLTARADAYALVSEQVREAVASATAGRRAGPLLLTASGERLDRRTSARWVSATARRAGVPFRVTQMTLTYSLRALAIEHGFSYAGVVRAVGELHPSKSRRWVTNAPNIADQHAALRLSQLVFIDPASPHGVLQEARNCLGQSMLPAAVAVMAAGAALENHLRALARDEGIVWTKPEKQLQLSHYSDQLSARRVITRAEHGVLKSIEMHRNEAAHGWFDLMDDETARFVLAQTEKIIVAHPVTASASRQRT